MDVQRVCTTAKYQFLVRYVEKLEKEVHKHNQLVFIQCLKSSRTEDTQKIESQKIRDEKGLLLRDSNLVFGL